VDSEVVGSLCVLDTKKRKFSEENYGQLTQLAERVTNRLTSLADKRRQVRTALTHVAIHPAVNELIETLEPVHNHLQLGYTHLATTNSFFNLYEHTTLGKSKLRPSTKMSFEAAREANRMLENRLGEIESKLWDGMDCLNAVKSLVSKQNQTSLFEIVSSAQDIVRGTTRVIGGFNLPGFNFDPTLRTESNLAIALVSNTLLLISAELLASGLKDGIELQAPENKDRARLIFTSKGLDEKSYSSISEKLKLIVGQEHPTVSIESSSEGLELGFKIKRSEE